jgi:hypothetical protein
MAGEDGDPPNQPEANIAYEAAAGNDKPPNAHRAGASDDDNMSVEKPNNNDPTLLALDSAKRKQPSHDSDSQTLTPKKPKHQQNLHDAMTTHNDDSRGSSNNNESTKLCHESLDDGDDSDSVSSQNKPAILKNYFLEDSPEGLVHPRESFTYASYKEGRDTICKYCCVACALLLKVCCTHNLCCPSFQCPVATKSGKSTFTIGLIPRTVG